MQNKTGKGATASKENAWSENLRSSAAGNGELPCMVKANRRAFDQGIAACERRDIRQRAIKKLAHERLVAEAQKLEPAV